MVISDINKCILRHFYIPCMYDVSNLDMLLLNVGYGLPKKTRLKTFMLTLAFC